MTSINETINAAMQAAGMGNYRNQATPVVQALIDREQRIFTGIVDAGTQMGAQRQQVVAALAALDMAVPPGMDAGLRAVQPEPPFGQINAEPVMAEQGEDDLMRRVAALEEFARANGYTG